MEKLPAGGTADVIGPAYWETRRHAESLTAMQVRWEFRRLRRHQERLDDAGRARLCAYADELAARGMDMPS